MDTQNIYQKVQDHYGSLARAENSTHYSAIAKAFGYSEDELNSIPKDANLGVSCGNPLATASLREGETVVDLGSGAGFDIFLAAKKVGPQGRAIGVDMNKDMLARAHANLAKTPDAKHISFLEANITSIPLPNGTADCIISNCVVNLVPELEKPAVFAEMARLLKPGGRVAISDILAKKPLDEDLRQSMALYVGCVAGASMREEYVRWLEGNGFEDIVVVDAESDLNVYIDMAKENTGDSAGCCAPINKDISSSNSPDTKHADISLADINLNDWAGSFKIFAVKGAHFS
ncbi:SAM-dependent methyltransferase UbiE/COQ5 family protein [Massariosphaeria phaeospora]|uniref:Arsenite methyltransferase n=1 Tax=Massariosphaeria phaeospora TaxID=100035 RepID=A0A7C8HZ71_9PLEO|nr:SAM-dependent methyltransferase UbiE/COQ5 family protein [Massariosphaeria phaeospora]